MEEGDGASLISHRKLRYSLQAGFALGDGPCINVLALCERTAFGISAMITAQRRYHGFYRIPLLSHLVCGARTECKTMVPGGQSTRQGRDPEAFSLEEGDVFGLISHRKLRLIMGSGHASPSLECHRARTGGGSSYGDTRVCAMVQLVPLPPPAHRWIEKCGWWAQPNCGPSEFFKVRKRLPR